VRHEAGQCVGQLFTGQEVARDLLGGRAQPGQGVGGRVAGSTRGVLDGSDVEHWPAGQLEDRGPARGQVAPGAGEVEVEHHPRMPLARLWLVRSGSVPCWGGSADGHHASSMEQSSDTLFLLVSCVNSKAYPRRDEMAYVIGEPCIDVVDRACVDECPVDCIYEGARALYIQPDECIDCGACEPVCPVEAIYYEDDLPEELTPYLADNATFFTEPLPGCSEPLGSPGGAAKLGAIGVDTELVASHPPDE